MGHNLFHEWMHRFGLAEWRPGDEECNLDSDLVTMLFVEQPLALPGFAKNPLNLCDKILWLKGDFFLHNQIIPNVPNIRHKDFCSSFSNTLLPLNLETGWTGELWSKTNLLKWQNLDFFLHFYGFINFFALKAS